MIRGRGGGGGLNFLTSSSNLANINEDGVFSGTGAVGERPSGVPSGLSLFYFVLTVKENSYQVIDDPTQNQIFYRGRLGNGWGIWIQNEASTTAGVTDAEFDAHVTAYTTHVTANADAHTQTPS